MNKDFFEAIGLEGSFTQVLKQLAVGVFIGIIILSIIGIGNCIGDWLSGV